MILVCAVEIVCLRVQVWYKGKFGMVFWIAKLVGRTGFLLLKGLVLWERVFGPG